MRIWSAMWGIDETLYDMLSKWGTKTRKNYFVVWETIASSLELKLMNLRGLLGHLSLEKKSGMKESNRVV